MSDYTLTINHATLILVKIILQQNGHPDITDNSVGEALLKAVKTLRQENDDREGP